VLKDIRKIYSDRRFCFRVLRVC